MKIRTFIALDIPDPAISEMLRIRDFNLGGDARVRWESKDKLHITLKFLGETDSDKIQNYSNALEDLLVNHKSMNLSFKEFGLFKRGEELKILWAGLKKNDELTDLALQIDNLFCTFGFEKEKRKFKPHITLLRFRGNEDQKKIVSLTGLKLPAIDFVSDTVTFYESKLTGGGSVYRSIKKIYLKK